MYIIYPNFEGSDAGKVEPEYAQEKQISEMSGFGSILVDHTRIEKLNPKFIVNPYIKPGKAIYRGWMMSPEQYEFFYLEMLKARVELVTNPIAYKALHYYPIAYKFFKQYGIDSFSTNKPLENIRELYAFMRCYGKVTMKDFVKSEKGTKFQFIDGTVSRDKFRKLVKEFIEFRGDHYNKGIVLRKYIDCKLYENKDNEKIFKVHNEWRAFFFMGKLLCLEQNSNLNAIQCTSYYMGERTVKYSVPRPNEEMVKKAAKSLSNLSPFFTIDFIEDKNGEFFLLESGDGQVSGFAPRQSAFMTFKDMKDILERSEKNKEVREFFTT